MNKSKCCKKCEPIAENQWLCTDSRCECHIQLASKPQEQSEESCKRIGENCYDFGDTWCNRCLERKVEQAKKEERERIIGVLEEMRSETFDRYAYRIFKEVIDKI